MAVVADIVDSCSHPLSTNHFHLCFFSKSKPQWGITSHRNANQNHSEVSPHTGQIAIIKNLQIINAREGMEKVEPFYAVRECKLAQPLWNQFVGSLKN